MLHQGALLVPCMGRWQGEKKAAMVAMSWQQSTLDPSSVIPAHHQETLLTTALEVSK